ncbi:hypothetical protein F7725_010471 [Dissostichus mawsoni]|uniref:Uncharacterized protein n=1 Tax=Dissostichus mawsoni TaxID=36200 RepID=A0A7J5XPB3_DISMA|nr:hypothetical protein F7725_010471 [Dissostichus mawsoni]
MKTCDCCNGKRSFSYLNQSDIGQSSLFYDRFTLRICIIVPTSYVIKCIYFIIQLIFLCKQIPYQPAVISRGSSLKKENVALRVMIASQLQKSVNYLFYILKKQS